MMQDGTEEVPGGVSGRGVGHGAEEAATAQLSLVL